MSAGKPVWSVVGDVCIDWLSIPVDPVAASEHEPNWRLCGGGHMFATRGGAWLTADLLEALAGERARVIKPVPREHLESVPPEEVLHSQVRLQAFPAAPGDKARVWRVARFEGYAGPLQGVPLPAVASEQPEAKAAMVVVDDAGNGFRRRADAWPAALAPEARPLVLYKMRRPLMEGELWKHLHAHHAGRTVAILNADDLRASGALISRCLSWERTAYDTWRALAQAPHLQPLRGCAWLVVTFGHEGALVARTRDGQVDAARLWFVPQMAEGDLLRSGLGDMSGGGAAFTAGLAASLPAVAALDLDVMGEATRQGLVAARQIWAAGFGPPERVDARDKKKRSLNPPAFPSGAAAAGLVPPVPPQDFPLVSVPLPALRAGLSPADVERQRDWRILDMLRREPMEELAFAALERGVEKVFGSMPCGVFGKLVSLDRVEIEGLRTIRNLMLEYVRLARPERPLCLAVFGQPGSGKSFGVTQVALSVARSVRDAEIERIEFNVSQWDSPAHLVQALHRVRDITIRGKVPLVFFDEFDSTLGGAPLGWLKSFLAPMQDGVFSDGQFTYLIGRAILVFAGGTAHSFGAFSARADDPQLAGAKVSDFLSRLRGHVNVLGFGTPTGTNLVRRAVVLRVALQKKFPALFDAGGRLRIEPALAHAFLTVDRYRHGARSIEAIVEMSRLLECGQYDASSLPPASQLDQHVDAEAFLAIMARPLALGEHLERLARAIHERYLQGQLKRGARVGDRPALQPWEQLEAVFQNSNREQAAHIPLKLAAVHCELVPRGERAGAAFEFRADELEQLARMEHARWMEERRLAQPQHPDLRPWEELPPDEQQKDRDAALAIPELVASAGLAIRRLV
jgi:hypothetical protein